MWIKGWQKGGSCGGGACRAFEYFLLINSSVRGPFLPTYLPSEVHWTQIFTSKLTADTKLVGSTINCGGAYTISEMQPHIQSYALALDQARPRTLP